MFFQSALICDLTLNLTLQRGFILQNFFPSGFSQMYVMLVACKEAGIQINIYLFKSMFISLYS